MMTSQGENKIILQMMMKMFHRQILNWRIKELKEKTKRKMSRKEPLRQAWVEVTRTVIQVKVMWVIAVKKSNERRKKLIEKKKKDKSWRVNLKEKSHIQVVQVLQVTINRKDKGKLRKRMKVKVIAKAKAKEKEIEEEKI